MHTIDPITVRVFVLDYFIEGDIGIFGFGYFLDRFFHFCAKRRRFFGFGVRCGLWIFRFLASGFRFS